MTLLSCLAIGLAFVIAVGLLVLAGSLIGLSIPLRLRRPRVGPHGPSRTAPEGPGGPRPRDGDARTPSV